MLDLAPPPSLWLPSKPALIRSAADLAMPLAVTRLYGFGVGGSSVVWEHTHDANNSGDIGPYTFNSVNIGTATADRLVVVMVSGSTDSPTRTISSVSIDGTNGTVHAASTQGPTGVASRVVSSGTSISVVVTFSGGVFRCWISVFTIKNYRSATPVTSVSNGTTGTSDSWTVDIPAGGVALFGSRHNGSTAATWSNATEQYNNSLESTIFTTAARATAGTGTAVSVSWSGSVQHGGPSAVWR